MFVDTRRDAVGAPLSAHWSLAALLRKEAFKLLFVLAGFLFLFWPALLDLFQYWADSADFSHGFLVPLISLFILFSSRRELEKLPAKRSLFGLAVLAFLSSCGSLGLADIHELKQYEGTYQLVTGKYPACTRHLFVEVSYDQITNHLAVEPLDAQRRHRRWSWLEFGPLNDEPQIANSDFFGLLVYYKYFAKKTDDGWQAQRLRKECQLKFVCGWWHLQELISFTDQAFQLGLLADTQQCTCRRLISPQ